MSLLTHTHKVTRSICGPDCFLIVPHKFQISYTSSMKRMLLGFLLTIGWTLTPISYVNAATEGCPDSWKIDTSSNPGYEELQQAKNRLGVDLALSEPVIQYQNYSGELGPLAAPKGRGALTIEDIYLYGKTQVLWKIDVQQKNCLGKATFVFSRGTLSEYLGFKNVVLNVDPQSWAVANESSFADFTKAAQFGACIKSIQLRISPPNIGLQLEGKLLVISFGNVLRNTTFNDPCGVRKINPRSYFIYQDLTPECQYFSEQSGRSIAIRKGGSCEIAIALPTRESLIVFTKFAFKAKDFEVAVACVKGKSTKKVTAYRGYEYNAKCPAGYKKK